MISFAHNIAEFERSLSDAARRQIPFAVALALNDTAAEVKQAWPVTMERKLDRPTPFTKRGIYQRRASKSRRTATVGIKDIQADYLRWQVAGGARLPRGRAILVPVAQRRNKYGNMPKGAVKRLLAKPDVFAASSGARATRHLAPGIYKRPKRGAYMAGRSRKHSGSKAGYGSKNRGKAKGPQLLVSFEPQAAYRPRLDLERPAFGVARDAFPRHFSRRLKAALSTAR